ncbi:MAG TPA: alpha-glucosidase/alpha-galactosidase [Candidatus Brocadiia bacterium]|nr:alpha-glucosidase/alpha-galactosidase [Candidatus Brocadiia bacterium]
MAIKITLIGAGSHSFGRGTIADVLSCRELGEAGAKLVLADVDEAALARMHGLAARMKEHFRSPISIESTTDRHAALAGADFVVISVAVRRMELWEQDFRVPLAFGFKHVLGENGGPGALFHALRSYELVVPLCREIEAICPDATVFNFTNPESRVCMAISKLTSLKFVGICHGVSGGRGFVSRILERPEEELDMITGGLNHFFWFLKIADAATGEDLYPELVARLRGAKADMCPRLTRRMLDLFGLLMFPSDDHIGEYVSFAYEDLGLRWHYGRECRSVPRPDGALKPESQPVNWSDANVPLDESVLRPSGEHAVPMIRDIVTDSRRWWPSVNVSNTGLYVGNVAEDAIVEVPAEVDGRGVHPQKVGPLPEALAAMCSLQISIQKIIVEAYAKRSKKLLLEALLLDPVVDSAQRAGQLLDAMLELQKDYLPRFE